MSFPQKTRSNIFLGDENSAASSGAMTIQRLKNNPLPTIFPGELRLLLVGPLNITETVTIDPNNDEPSDDPNPLARVPADVSNGVAAVRGANGGMPTVCSGYRHGQCFTYDEEVDEWRETLPMDTERPSAAAVVLGEFSASTSVSHTFIKLHFM